MPAYIMGPGAAAGVKIVNSNAKNPDRGLPAVSGIMVYIDPESGLALALMGAGALTGMRTGAAGGVAAKYMARKNSKTIGLVGCGRQARTQAEALQLLFPVERALVWGKTRAEAETFVRDNKSALKMELVIRDNVAEACAADIIVTTTPVRKPVVLASMVKPGTHINAIGADAPGKQELETALVKKARVVVDEWHQASHAGEINVPFTAGALKEKDLVGQLGEIVTGKKPGRTSDNDITVFDSTGLALQDVAVAKVVYEKALKLKKGQVLTLNG
jgi:alanine dehydrogenase